MFLSIFSRLLCAAKPELNLDTTNNLYRWLVCAYFVLCTVSTIGYGDITPVSIAEIGLNIIFILIGVAYFGYVISYVVFFLFGGRCMDRE